LIWFNNISLKKASQKMK